MKKRVSLLLTLVLLISIALPTQAFAASYPLVYINRSESSATIVEGYVGMLSFTIFPEYKNERLNVYVYDSDGTAVASKVKSFYNSSILYKDYILTVNTGDLDMDPGTYKVVYWMEFYSLYSWHSAPNQYTYTFKVLKDICKGNHDFEVTYVYSEATCTTKGKVQMTCSDCGHIVVEETDLVDHEYGEPEITVNPTPESEGEAVYTCVNCSTTKTEVIPTSAAVKIKTQPKSVIVSADETAKFTVKATGDGLTYQWYYKDTDDTEWKEASSTKASYSTKNTVARNGREFYCLVADQYGNSEESDIVSMHLPVVEITEQPEDAWAYEGEKAKVSVTATGDGLTYQWYYSSDDGETWKAASGTDASYSLEMTAARDNRQMKCVVTDAYGNTAESDVVTLDTRFKATIVEQPADAKAYEDEKAVTAVVASGDGITYQWYYKNPGSSSFKKSSITTAECAVTMTESRDGREMYCIVTDEYGNTAQSDTVTLTMKKTAAITTQPADAWAYEGEKAKVSVTATGDGLTYQWYYSSDEGETWKAASGTSKSYSLKMTAARDGRQMKCVVTDEYGNSVESNVVTLDTRFKATITKQPTDASAYEGEKAKTKVKATGDGLTYQWYYKDPGMSAFKKSSIVKASASVAMKESRDGREMYCIVTDEYGNTAQSDTVTLTMRTTLAITTQPTDVTKAEGETAKFKVKATGDGLTYQWYYKSPTGTEWKECSGTSATYSLKATEARNGRMLYCEITDEYGSTVKTNVVTLTVE